MDELTLTSPLLLGFLLMLPVLAWAYVRTLRSRRAAIAGLGGTLAAPTLRGWLPAALMLLGLGVLILALTRPKAVVGLPRFEGTVMLAFDVSGSMAADDIQPTRLEASKRAAAAFVQQQPAAVTVGVVSFSESGFTIQPPTHDRQLVLAAINRLSTARGTSLATGIGVALEALAAEGVNAEVSYLNSDAPPTPTPEPLPPGTNTSRAIVLLTDGENTVQPDPMLAAQAAIDRGVRIYTVGVGSPTGSNLTIDGFNIFTQLDEPVLRALAEQTSGQYYNAQSDEDLRAIYGDLGTQLVVKREATELTAPIVGLALALLLSGVVLALLWLGRLP